MESLEIVRSLERVLVENNSTVHSGEDTRQVHQTYANEVQLFQESRILVFGNMLELASECSFAGGGLKAGLHLDPLLGSLSSPDSWDHHFPGSLDLTIASLRFARACHRWFSYSPDHIIIWANIWGDDWRRIKRIVEDFSDSRRKTLLWENSDSEIIESLKFEFCSDSVAPYFLEKNRRHFVG